MSELNGVWCQIAIRHVETIAAAPPSKSQNPAMSETKITAPITGSISNSIDGMAAESALALSI